MKYFSLTWSLKKHKLYLLSTRSWILFWGSVFEWTSRCSACLFESELQNRRVCVCMRINPNLYMTRRPGPAQFIKEPVEAWANITQRQRATGRRSCRLQWRVQRTLPPFSPSMQQIPVKWVKLCVCVWLVCEVLKYKFKILFTLLHLSDRFLHRILLIWWFIMMKVVLCNN